AARGRGVADPHRPRPARAQPGAAAERPAVAAPSPRELHPLVRRGTGGPRHGRGHREAVSAAVHEFLVAPAALVLAFLHARAALGTRRALGELATLAFYGFGLERLAMGVFGSHPYGSGWTVALLRL